MSSSPSRDPFPMSSPEALQLESSVDGSLSNWGSMANQSAALEPAIGSSDVHHGGVRESLMSKAGGRKKKHPDQSDDIYATLDRNDSDNDKEDYFDIPLTDRRGSTLHRATRAIARTFQTIYTRLYGDRLPLCEMLRTLTLAMTLFFMIGGIWIFRSLKDPILTSLCGVTAIPKAKMLSVLVVLAVVSVYNRLLDSDIPRHQLFYIIGTFYCALFTIISLLLMHPTIGLNNEQPHSSRILGWVAYCSAESFGSVMVSLFWSFCNSNVSLETAKASFGVMVAFAQLGSILGPTIVHHYVTTIGVAYCYLLGAGCMILLQCTMYFYIYTYGAEERNGVTPTIKSHKPKAGILEGLELFWNYNYVKGIFAMSTLFMIIGTIIDFTMKLLAKDYFASLHPCEIGMSCFNTDDMGMSQDATASFTSFMGLFGQATNTLSFLFSLFGTSAIIRYLGLRLTLLLFPTLCLILILSVRLKPTLYVTFSAMMVLKASIYALNNPTKELLYQPTSSSVRYKAKSWIDIFGARSAKALGSVVTNSFSNSVTTLVANGSLVGILVASFLIWNARYMGKKFDDYTESGFVVGERDDHVPLTTMDDEDTSCAILDEVGADEEGKGNVTE